MVIDLRLQNELIAPIPIAAGSMAVGNVSRLRLGEHVKLSLLILMNIIGVVKE